MKHDDFGDENTVERVVQKKVNQNKEKIPWYFSTWFILILYITTFWCFCIPAIIINILRIVKYKNKKTVPGILLMLVIVFVGFTVLVLVLDSKENKKFNSWIENGEYERAQSYLDDKMKSSKEYSLYRKYAELYAVQGMNDEATLKIMEYCNGQKLAEIPSYIIKELDNYAESSSDLVKNQAVELHEKYDIALAQAEEMERKKKEENESTRVTEKQEKKKVKEKDKEKEEAQDQNAEEEIEASKELKKNDEMLGILGKDCSLSVFDSQPKGKKFIFTGIFWSVRYDKYGYNFSYKQLNADGSLTNQEFFVKDDTDNLALKALDDVSYEDEVAVKMTVVFDKTEIFVGNDSGSTQVIYYVTAKEAEILEADSPEAKEARGNYRHIGDKVALNNGVTYTVTDGGLYTENAGTESARPYVYVEVDIDNQSGEDIFVDVSDAIFYADDYVLDTGFPSAQDANNIINMTISDKRRGRGRFYAECFNYNDASRIEVEIGNTIIIIKDIREDISDSSEIQNNRNLLSNSINYGTYSYDNGVDAVCNAEVGIYTDEKDEDYIKIECWGYGGA